MSNIIKVKREGGKGWHWIDAARFDPEVHEAVTEDVAETKPKRGPKQRKEV